MIQKFYYFPKKRNFSLQWQIFSYLRYVLICYFLFQLFRIFSFRFFLDVPFIITSSKPLESIDLDISQVCIFIHYFNYKSVDISSDPSLLEGHVRFTTVPLYLIINYVEGPCDGRGEKKFEKKFKEIIIIIGLLLLLLFSVLEFLMWLL